MLRVPIEYHSLLLRVSTNFRKVIISFFNQFFLIQYSKLLQNPTTIELQKAANQGRRCTWEKFSAIKANCGIELALDECVAMLNHMRRLKRSADRAAAASHGLASTVRFNGSKRIPSWNCIARENSTGSLEEDLLADMASSLRQGGGASTSHSSRNWRTHRNLHDGSDSESESADLNSWTRSGGPLMRTTSADKFIDFVQNLDAGFQLNKGLTIDPNNVATQIGSSRDPLSSQSPRVLTPDRISDTEFEQRDISYRIPVSSSSIMVAEGDLLQAERSHNGIVFNVVKRGDLTPSSRSHDSEYSSPMHDSVAECVQLDSLEKETDTSSTSEDGDHHDYISSNQGGNTNTENLSSNNNVDDNKRVSDA